MPKFEANCDAELKDTLSSIGLSAAFNPDKADFSNMGKANGNLYISSLKHNTSLKIDELGTEAGAVTNVEMMNKSAMKFINFNRPFVYAIIDTKTNLPLFLGAMQNPNK
jgi:serine protease inhibitor